MARDDSNRVRGSLTNIACAAVDDCASATLTFQHWFPFDERVPPSNANLATLIYFDNVTQNATTLSGGGATVEEGVLVVDLICSQTQLACGSITLGGMYGTATKVAGRFTVGTTVHIASITDAGEAAAKGAHPNTSSKITISQQPIVGPGFMMRRNSECHIPVQIGYKAVTNGPD